MTAAVYICASRRRRMTACGAAGSVAMPSTVARATWGWDTTALIGLAEVRRMWHGELRPLLRQGIDPIEHRKAGRLAQAAATARAMSVDQCIDAYYQAYRGTWRSVKHARGWLQTLRTNFSPVIGAMPVAAVERQDVVRALQPYWQTAQTSAHRTALRLENVFDWAIAAGYRAGPNPAQWAGGLEHLLPRTKIVADTRHAALPYGELPTFMEKLRAVDRGDARALEFLILTVRVQVRCASPAGPRSTSRMRCGPSPQGG